jgi:hypothetical protein
MKKLKFLLLAIALIIIIASCSDNALTSSSASSQTLSSSQVPSAVQSTLTTNFPTATNTTWAKVSPTVYQASFQASAKSMLASITSSGALLYSHNRIDPATLPTTITTYLETNYAGYVIKKAGSRTDSTGTILDYLVEFSLNNQIYEIRFDASGTFLSLEMEDGSHECTELAETDLPTAITSYLTTNYNGYTFNHARAIKTNGIITGYGVEITYNNVKVRLLFDATGAFVSLDTTGDGKGHPQDSTKSNNHGKGTLVAQADLLAVITTYLNPNYSGYTFVSAMAFLDGTTIKGYGVKITYQGKTYDLEFDATGTFKKVH